jgi:hypothetical protein
MCGVSLAIVLALYFYSFTFPKSSRPVTGRQRAVTRAAALSGETGETAKVSFASSWAVERKAFMASLLTIPAAFWIIDLTQLAQGGAVSAYSGALADTIKVTRNATSEASGYTSAIGQVIPILLTPALGAVFDRWGHRYAFSRLPQRCTRLLETDSFSFLPSLPLFRTSSPPLSLRSMAWVTWTAALWIVVFSLLAYTQTNALAVSILGSLALATNVLPWIASIPLLVPRQASLGTAFGIYKAVSQLPSSFPQSAS